MKNLRTNVIENFKNYVYDHLSLTEASRIEKLPNVSDDKNLVHILRNTNL
jgi:hypothetical protein